MNIEVEIWKDVPGYEGDYMVSNLGRIKSLPKKIRNRNQTFRIKPETILKTPCSKAGYPVINLCKNKKRRLSYVHILVATAFIPNPDNKKEVNHKKGIKADNRAPELEWTTPAENSQHAYDIGLSLSKGLKGDKNPSAKLKSTDIPTIKDLLSDGVSKRQIGLRYGVSSTTIADIAKNKKWNYGQ